MFTSIIRVGFKNIFEGPDQVQNRRLRKKIKKRQKLGNERNVRHQDRVAAKAEAGMKKCL